MFNGGARVEGPSGVRVTSGQLVSGTSQQTHNGYFDDDFYSLTQQFQRTDPLYANRLCTSSSW